MGQGYSNEQRERKRKKFAEHYRKEDTTIEEACDVAGISKTTYYEWNKGDSWSKSNGWNHGDGW